MAKSDMQNSVLAVLASKEKTIEALRRELDEKKYAVELLGQREEKSKGHVLKLKAMIQPLGDELVNQKKQLEQAKSEAALQRGEVEARSEELVEKCLLIDRLKEEVATLEVKSKEMEELKVEAIDVERGKLKAMEEKLMLNQKEAQEKVEAGLDTMNQETTRDTGTTKLWRRISMINTPYRRSEQQIDLLGTTTWGVRKVSSEHH